MNSRKKQDQTLYYLGFGKDKWENIRLFLYCFFRRFNICILQPGSPSEVEALISRVKYFRRYKESKIRIDDVVLGDIKGKR